MARTYRELPAIRESTEDYERLETRIREAFKRELYHPILKALGGTHTITSLLQNDSDALQEALRKGRVRFYKGRFTGKFTAGVSRELKSLGAKWSKGESAWVLARTELPPEVVTAIDASQANFDRVLSKIDRDLGEVLPSKIAESIKMADLFDSTLFRVDRDMDTSLRGVTVLPTLTEEARARIADEWQENLRISIKDFADEEILKLRRDVAKAVNAGSRYEATAKAIQRSFGVTADKAKFLARQETGLLMAKHKEVRYTSAGIHEYKWRCVAGSKLHPVRPAHRALDGSMQRWDAPPISTSPGEPQRRNNPGQDYNCRCMAIPIVRFKGTS